MIRHPLLLVGIATLLSACDADVETRRAAVAPVEDGPALAAATVPATPAGPGRTVRPQADDYLQSAASVLALTPLADHDVDAKVFGTAGGDPALNGNHAWLAFFAGPAEGWTVYALGDFEDWSVTEQAGGRFVLDTTQGRMGDTGDMVTGERKRFIIAYSPGGDANSPPTSITITPAS
ncbi:hypothetical protein [uncultured Brevundimonas sp.]|uniref:hypothetical protein n=1 Tax=uncultured Brevundimonas sp. TaxID=213418 RepID=UPI0030EDFC05|tara:strand:+ start:2150 stop:2683 length:534 start_codon:yes stop_codon:yes gene_type:complete